jgi:phage tail-like protein
MPSDSDPLGGDLPVADRFLFEVDGVEIGIFREVSGLQVTVNVVEIAEGGQNSYLHKLPSRMTWPNIVFKRGLTQGDALFDWLQKSSGEQFASNSDTLTKSTGAVTAITATGQRLRSWEFIDVFPVRWKGPDFTVGSVAPLEEELEVAHHGFRSKTQASA